jgi:serine/threonine protein kinase
MGVVFAAKDLQLGRKIAIKLVRPQALGALSATDRQSWLMREACAMAQISHPNVVAVHDVGTFGDQLFIAMEYVEGKTLSDWLTEQHRPWRDILGMFIQAGRGLAAAHAQQILHGDFKPENVVVGQDGRARVVDFGLARPREMGARCYSTHRQVLADTNVTSRPATPNASQRGNFIGTPGYMAPEQLTGEPLDERTDQYSFCVALFQGLYGHLPFKADTLGGLLAQIKRGRVNEVPKFTDVPPPLHQVLLQGLSRDPMDRFPSMGALLDKLEQQRVPPRQTVLDITVLAVTSIFGALLRTLRQQRITHRNTFSEPDTVLRLE